VENLDIILLTAVVSVLFLVFIIATYREFSVMGKSEFKGGKEKGPRAEMVQFLQKVFTDETIEPDKKKELLSIIKKTFDEMDSGEKPAAMSK
jgi:predicted signal transduction protein with EAL and GGDEF domain